MAKALNSCMQEKLEIRQTAPEWRHFYIGRTEPLPNTGEQVSCNCKQCRCICNRVIVLDLRSRRRCHFILPAQVNTMASVAVPPLHLSHSWTKKGNDKSKVCSINGSPSTLFYIHTQKRSSLVQTRTEAVVKRSPKRLKYDSSNSKKVRPLGLFLS